VAGALYENCVLLEHMKFGLVFTQDLLQGARNLVALEVSKIDCSTEKITLGMIQVKFFGGHILSGEGTCTARHIFHARIPKSEHPQKTTSFLGDDSFLCMF
jgi:hypothetical protein